MSFSRRRRRSSDNIPGDFITHGDASDEDGGEQDLYEVSGEQALNMNIHREQRPRIGLSLRTLRATAEYAIVILLIQLLKLIVVKCIDLGFLDNATTDVTDFLSSGFSKQPRSSFFRIIYKSGCIIEVNWNQTISRLVIVTLFVIYHSIMSMAMLFSILFNMLCLCLMLMKKWNALRVYILQLWNDDNGIWSVI